MNKVLKIILNSIPVVLMIVLIPFVSNDYLLSGIFVVVIAASLLIKYERKDYLFLIFGFLIMIIVEYLFTSTGVETFDRNSLFGVMPVWLPILWAYSFVAMKRAINILK